MTRDPRLKSIATLETTLLFDIVIDLDAPLKLGKGPLGKRVLFGATGGSFDGPRLRGEVLAGGGDWALLPREGAMTLDVRITLRAHDGALIHMAYAGRFITPPDLRAEMADPVARSRVDPSRYYFRTNPLFETGAPAYAWLNDVVCVGSGYLVEGGIAYRVWQCL